jgi:hypothetical protein
MLYLKSFFSILKFEPLWTTLYLASFLVLSLSLGQVDSIEKTMAKKIDLRQDPYFHVLIDRNQNVSKIARKLTELPGVMKVKSLPTAELERTLGEVVEQVDASLESLVSDFPFEGIKIVLKNELGSKGEKIIRNYIKRLAGGSDNVNFGVTVREDVAKRKKALASEPLYVKALSYKHHIVIAFSFFVWFFLSMVFFKKMKGWLYCMEHFQRKSNFNFKVPIYGLALVTVLSLIAQSLIIGSINYTAFSMMLIPLALTWWIATDVREWE